MIKFTSTALRVDDQGVWVLDQTRLPHQEVWLESKSADAMVAIIKELRVRGAPLIGIAASLQLGRMVEEGCDSGEFKRALIALHESRPTAVNLMNALDRLERVVESRGLAAVPMEALAVAREDFDLCERMARHGLTLINKSERILTHCNTGGLATAGFGTALGVIHLAHREGLSPHIFVDETRPLLQGARLTTWELARAGIPHTLICDNMAAYLMQRKQIDRVLVGADRIAANGDFANKVGTYGLAVLCQYHKVPFHVVAPMTTVDPSCQAGIDIPIEERKSSEVRGVRLGTDGIEWAPEHVEVWNPAFDVTPAELVTSWITDQGVWTAGDIQKGVLK